MYAVDEDESENIQETRDNDEERQAWCLLAESANEQLQEVISRRDTQKVKKAKVASLLSVENSQKPSSKKFIKVKDRWVEVRVTGHVMPEGLFPRVKFERKTPPKKFAAANGERIKDLREKRLPFKTHAKMHNIQKYERCQTSHCNAESCPSWNHRGAG